MLRIIGVRSIGSVPTGLICPEGAKPAIVSVISTSGLRTT
jgi:hypothetical protein